MPAPGCSAAVATGARGGYGHLRHVLHGVAAAGRFAELARAAGLEPATAALAWAAQQPGVTTVIPGARTAEQARANAAAGEVAPLPPELLSAMGDLYDEVIRPLVHHRW